MWSSVSSSSVCDLWSDCRGLCFSCDLRYISCWHFELIFADLLLKRIFLDSGSQPFPSFFGGSVQVYDVSNYYIFSPLSYITNILLCEFEYYYDNLFVHACNEALNYGYLVQHSCNFHFVPWQESGRSAIQVRRRGNKSWRWTTSMTHAYPTLIVIMKNNIIIFFFKSIFGCLLQIEQKEVETLEIELKEKVVSLSNLQKELEQEKVLCC